LCCGLQPQQNAYVERYNRTVRYSWLSQYLFDSSKELQDDATGWLWFYNHERPNRANGGLWWLVTESNAECSMTSALSIS